MTKYILQSGGIKNEPQKKKSFHLEAIKTLGKSPKILICIFPQLRETWEEKFPIYSQSILEDMPAGTVPEFKLAMPDTFEQDCKDSDIIYINGGDDHLTMYWLRQFDIPNIWEGKVVCTNSASSDALSSHFWTCDWRKAMDGLAILPIKFLPHYQSTYGASDPRGPVDWEKGLRDLKAYGDTTLPVHALPEGDYIVITQ